MMRNVSNFLRRSLTSRMSYSTRKEIPLKHLFDGSELNVYDTMIVNLSAGTPGEGLLKDCCEIFEIATTHRMVRTVLIFNQLVYCVIKCDKQTIQEA